MLGAPAAPSAADAPRLAARCSANLLLPKPAPPSAATDLHAATSVLSLPEFYLQTRTYPVFRSLPTQFSPSGCSSRGISCSLCNPIALFSAPCGNRNLITDRPLCPTPSQVSLGQRPLSETQTPPSLRARHEDIIKTL